MATSIFSASKDNASNPAASILHRTPIPAAWCPWVSPTGVEAALSSMSWRRQKCRGKIQKMPRQNVMNYRWPFSTAYRGSLATKGGATDAASFHRAGKVVESRRAFMLSPGRPVARGAVGRCDDHIFVVEQSASAA